MPLPKLSFASPAPAAAATSRGITLVVYAPFGTDPALSGYPDGVPKPIEAHPLVLNLAGVAACGVHVVALVDLLDGPTYLVEYAANASQPQITPHWKQQMDSPATLLGLLTLAQQRHPGTAQVLALEGHGAGYLPELDRRLLTADTVTDGGRHEWRLGRERGEPVLPMGSPLLPMGSPLLPMGSPLLPLGHVPMSTWALGQALRKHQAATGTRLAVVHLDNCFNMAVEVLHTLAPCADYATGYINYNFFTAGAAYADAFGQFRLHGNLATTQQLATWLAEANGRVLRAKSHHPTVGAAVKLSQLPKVAAAVDRLAKALITALDGGDDAQHDAVAEKIRLAIRRAQQYDTHTPMTLDAPDELTDLGSLARALSTFDVNAAAVQSAARALLDLLAGTKVYGESGTPWVAPEVRWDFSRPELSMSILCPDPDLIGLWDWRSPFYLQTDAETRVPKVQPHVIDFLKQTAWVPFIIAYHRRKAFHGLRPAQIPSCVAFNPKHNLP